MHMRRYTRLTNAHSEKFENHCHMVALYTVWYNFARINSAVKMAPAMAAGVSKTLWTMDNIVALIDAAAPAPQKRGRYKKREQSAANSTRQEEVDQWGNLSAPHGGVGMHAESKFAPRIVINILSVNGVRLTSSFPARRPP